MLVGARQSFQFFRQIIWFLGNNRAFTKVRYQILHNLISTIKLEKNQSLKANLKLTTRATLTRIKRLHFHLICWKNRRQKLRPILKLEVWLSGHRGKYTDRLKRLDLLSLGYPRAQGDMTELYKHFCCCLAKHKQKNKPKKPNQTSKLCESRK